MFYGRVLQFLHRWFLLIFAQVVINVSDRNELMILILKQGEACNADTAKEVKDTNLYGGNIHESRFFFKLNRIKK